MDISGWTIRTTTSAIDAIIGDGVILSAGQLYLIADIGWSEKKDDPLWRDADTEQAITLKNSDSGVGLFNGSVKIDAVGWGDVTDPLLVEGSPAAQVEPGMSLTRQTDTGDNSQDMIARAADFSGGLVQNNQQGISVQVTVPDTSITIIDTFLVDDDPTREGIQILPIVLGNKTISVTVTINSSSPVSVTADFLGEKIDLVNTSGSFTGDFLVDMLLFPGVYALVITADNGIVNTSVSQDIEIMSVIGFDLSSSSLTFENDSLSMNNSILVTNIGNVALDLGISGTDLVSGSSTLPIDRITVHYNEVDQPGLIRPLAPVVEVLNTDLLPQQTLSLGFAVSIPAGLLPGTYSGKISLVGIAN